jgi:septal ring factor EnvC (AmiA/AmiB activator)
VPGGWQESLWGKRASLPNADETGMLIPYMNNRIGLIIMILLCVALGAWLFFVKKEDGEKLDQDARVITQLTNEVAQKSAKLDEQKHVGEELEKKLDAQRKDYTELTNQYSVATSNLALASLSMVRAETALKASEELVKKRDATIVDLEARNVDLDQQAAQLRNAMTNLSVQIAETERKLSVSEGDRAFLQKELKRMQVEKAELERQFNDVNIVRAQLRKLKTEVAMAERRTWMQKGLSASDDAKGGQRMLQMMSTASAPPPPRPAYDLNVEVGADGKVRVIPPLTNAVPATTPPPGK